MRKGGCPVTWKKLLQERSGPGALPSMSFCQELIIFHPKTFTNGWTKTHLGHSDRTLTNHKYTRECCKYQVLPVNCIILKCIYKRSRVAYGLILVPLQSPDLSLFDELHGKRCQNTTFYYFELIRYPGVLDDATMEIPNLPCWPQTCLTEESLGL